MFLHLVVICVVCIHVIRDTTKLIVKTKAAMMKQHRYYVSKDTIHTSGTSINLIPMNLNNPFIAPNPLNVKKKIYFHCIFEGPKNQNLKKMCQFLFLCKLKKNKNSFLVFVLFLVFTIPN